MILISPKTWMNFFSWPKFDEGCWNYNMIPVHSRAMSILPSGAKKNGKRVFGYFAILAIILPLIWPLFCLSWENNTTTIICECSCIICPNVENVCPNNDKFYSVGNGIASPASPSHMLMSCTTILFGCSCFIPSRFIETTGFTSVA